MISGKRTAACLAAAVTAAVLPLTAWAGSPEFAYSAEKWATMRDDILEYDEIADLVHEYNPTVVQNRISWQEEKDQTSSEIAQSYYDAASDIYGNLTYPDSDDSSYGSRLAGVVQSRIQADQLIEQGDKSTDDSGTIKLGYEQTEANLVKQAQELMISYWSQRCSLESVRENQAQAQTTLQATETRLAAGTATQAQVLSAREAVHTAEASILSAESNLEKTKEDLCLMLGWSYGADVQIGEVPEPDAARIDAIDLQADIRTALANNYTLQKTRRQLANARSTTVRETLAETEKNQTEMISGNVSASYTELLLARSNYEQAQAACELQRASCETAGRKLQAGLIAPNDFQSRQASYQNAEVKVRTSRLALLKALVEYEWNVAGLASAS